MLHEHALARVGDDTAGQIALAGSLLGSTATFVNALGSTAAFAFGSDGSIAGTYTSQVSSGGGTVSGPITGWYNGYTIAWSVTWPTATPAITSWTGAVIQSGGTLQLDTLWYLSTQSPNPGEPAEFWNAVNAGADVFTQQ